MKISVLTLFPELVGAYFGSSLMAKAVERGLVEFEPVNIRDFATDRHKTCDDAPYGGGAGMVLKPGPLGDALDKAGAGGARTIYPTPSGRLFNQALARELAKEEALVFICGRYEGIDQRIIDLYVDDEISLGDYVISSGEVAALVMIDAVYRLLDGVIKAESLQEESFEQNLLEYPQYTRPEVYRGLSVPEVLLSGHHANIKKWQREQSLIKTMKNRPDLIGKTPDFMDNRERGE